MASRFRESRQVIISYQDDVNEAHKQNLEIKEEKYSMIEFHEWWFSSHYVPTFYKAKRTPKKCILYINIANKLSLNPLSNADSSPPGKNSSKSQRNHPLPRNNTIKLPEAQMNTGITTAKGQIDSHWCQQQQSISFYNKQNLLNLYPATGW